LEQRVEMVVQKGSRTLPEILETIKSKLSGGSEALIS
jgi:hypothetical protein